MYNQGNYASQFGQSPQTLMPPPYRLQPPGPPAPPPHFHQGPPGPPPPVYQHGPATPALVHQVPPVGMSNSSQSYLHPPPRPPFHGPPPISHVYPNAQHNLHPSPSAPSVLHLLPLGPPCPEMLGLPPHPRVLYHTPPSQGKAYRTPVDHPLQPGGMQGFKHIPLPPPPPPPPPPNFNFLAPTSFGGMVNSSAGDPCLPSFKPQPPSPPPPPPPPPSSPPPVPPSPPRAIPSPPSSFTPLVDSSNQLLNSEVSFPLPDASLKGSKVLPDVPLPPPKPMNEKVVQKIELLCQYIAKNGPYFEEMARQNESKNSEFEFLIGGEPGSEVAIAHEYFLWMKKKCNLACKVLAGQGDSPMRPIGMDSQTQPDHLMFAAGSCSSADSDMEIEGQKDFHHENSIFGGSESNVNSTAINSDGAAFPLDCKAEKSTSSLADKSSSVCALAVLGGTNGNSIKGGSPFSLLQDYASDVSSENDHDEPQLRDAGPVTVSTSISAGGTYVHSDTGCDLELDLGSNSTCKTEKGSGQLTEFIVSCIIPDSQLEVKETVATLTASGTSGEHVDNSHGNQVSVNPAAFQDTSHKNYDLGGGCANVVSKSGKDSTPLKVDEFGRLVRECATDSDSDDYCYTGWRRKRDRSWSRSRSPDRRSSHRRREKRGQSRSRSPRKRRSRSRSPTFRRAGEFSGKSTRRHKGQIPDCFDFLRGQCYRGASCRYLHHSERSNGLRHQRIKQQYLEVHTTKNSEIHVESKHITLSDNGHDDVKVQEKLLYLDMTGGSFGDTNNGNINQKKEDAITDALGSTCDEDGKLNDPGILKGTVPDMLVIQQEQQKPDVHILDDKYLKETLECHLPSSVDGFPFQPVGTADTPKSHGDTSQSVASLKNSKIQPFQSNLSVPVVSEGGYPRSQMDGSDISDVSADITSTTSLIKLSTNEVPKKFPSQSLVPEELSPPSPSAPDFPQCALSLPLPPPPLLPQGVNVPHMPQLPNDCSLFPQTASLPLQSASGENFPPYMLPNQPSHFSVTMNFSLTSLSPPPPRPPNVGTIAPSASTQFPHCHLPPRNGFGSQNFLRSHPTEFPTHSQAGEFQHRTYPPMEEPHRALMHGEDFRLNPLSLGGLPSQPSGGPGEAHSRLPKGPFAQANILNQNIPFEALPAKKMQLFSGEQLHLSEVLNSSHAYPYSQMQQLPYSVQHSTADSVSGLPRKISPPLSVYAENFVDRNQPSHLPDFGGSRMSTYNNPATSTFEQPLSSKFSSGVYGSEKFSPYGNKYDASISSSEYLFDGQGVSTIKSIQTTSSPKPTRTVGQTFPSSGGDQYDPLFDSIESSSNSFKKLDHSQKLDSVKDSDMMVSSINKPLDVEEKNVKDVGDHEFEETADAEVGAVENESPSNSIDAEKVNEGEIEIDQIKPSGKRKKSKDSRSMKLLKIAIADFVKEVLKPSWRQGNMSKEAFKTIVKKTVDKVSGAMKSHQIPKSQAKINQYIDSSQRKLTKLVMGYVDKYVNV